MNKKKNKEDVSRYSLRISPILLDKLGYIAEYEGRTKNKEIEHIIKKHIEEFEKKHEKIELEEKKQPYKIGCFLHIQFLKLPRETHVVCRENPAVQVIQYPRIARKFKFQPVRIQRLIIKAASPVVPVVFRPAVFPVAGKRVPDIREMRPYLMRPPRQQFDLDERHIIFFFQDFIFCLYDF